MNCFVALLVSTLRKSFQKNHLTYSCDIDEIRKTCIIWFLSILWFWRYEQWRRLSGSGWLISKVESLTATRRQEDDDDWRKRSKKAYLLLHSDSTPASCTSPPFSQTMKSRNSFWEFMSRVNTTLAVRWQHCVTVCNQGVIMTSGSRYALWALLYWHNRAT